MAVDVQRLLRAPGLRFGILAGLLGMALFQLFHVLLITSIYDRADAWIRGLGVAIVGGGIVGLIYEHVRNDLPGPSRLHGGLFGGLIAVTLLPFLLAGMARTAGASDAVGALTLVSLIGAAVIVLALGTTRVGEPIHGDALKRLGLVALAAVVLNAYPGYFLFNLGTIITSHVPQPLPFAASLLLIYVLCGAFLEFVLERRAAVA